MASAKSSLAGRLRLPELEVTPLVAYGGVALFAIFAYLGVGRLAGLAEAQRASVADMRAELASLDLLKDDTLWLTRRQQGEALRQERVQSVWTADTHSLIGARLQSTIRQSGEANGVEVQRVRVDPDVQLENGVSTLRFTADMRVEGASRLVRTLRDLQNTPQTIRLDDMTLSINAGRRSNLRLSGTVPVALSAEIAAASDGAGQ